MTGRLYVLPTARQGDLDLAVPSRDDIRTTCRCNGSVVSVRIGNFALCGGCAFELMRDQGRYHFTDLLHDAEAQVSR